MFCFPKTSRPCRKMDRKIKLKTLNPYITCNICKGYLIDATAITECLHTFCKSCIIKHLEANTTCPTCDIVIHHSYPRQYIQYDRTMQDIVYKLVTGLQVDEINREKEFYRQRGLPYPKEILIANGEETKEDATTKSSPEINSDNTSDQFNGDDLISVCLDCSNNRKVFVRVPIKTTIFYIKKFVARKLFNQAHLAHSLDVSCNCEILNRDDTLKYVYLTKWKFDQDPFVLKCCLNFAK